MSSCTHCWLPDPLDWSSHVTTLTVRPLTPPRAFSAAKYARAPYVGGEKVSLPSGPVRLAMIPIVIWFALTPTSGPGGAVAGVDTLSPLPVNAESGNRVPQAPVRASDTTSTTIVALRPGTSPWWHGGRSVLAHRGSAIRQLTRGAWPAPRSFHAGEVHAAQLLLQLGDLVAQPGGDLELQLAGRAQHLFVQLLDEIGQLRPRHGRHVEPASGVRPDADHAHRAAPAAAGHRRLAARLRPPGTTHRYRLGAEQCLSVGGLP